VPYLSYLGSIANMKGVLLWPAVAVHAALAVLLALRWLVSTRGNRTDKVAA